VPAGNTRMSPNVCCWCALILPIRHNSRIARKQQISSTRVRQDLNRSLILDIADLLVHRRALAHHRVAEPVAEIPQHATERLDQVVHAEVNHLFLFLDVLDLRLHGPRKPVGADLLEPLKPRGHVAVLPVLEQLLDQFEARVFLLHFLVFAIEFGGQQHLGLDLDQRGRHHDEVAHHVEVFLAHHIEETQVLVGDFVDGDVEDIDFLRLDQVQQNLERALEILEVKTKHLVGGFIDDKRGLAVARPRPFLFILDHDGMVSRRRR
jgi:hypothetical protein